MPRLAGQGGVPAVHVKQMGDALAAARSDWPAKLDVLSLVQIGFNDPDWDVEHKLQHIAHVTSVARSDCRQQFKPGVYTLRRLPESFLDGQPTLLPAELGEAYSGARKNCGIARLPLGENFGIVSYPSRHHCGIAVAPLCG